MTREDRWLKKADYRDCQVLVEEIIEHYNSRICENCKHYITEYTTRDNHCGYDGMFEIAEILRCTKDFGCNKFKKIEP